MGTPVFARAIGALPEVTGWTYSTDDELIALVEQPRAAAGPGVE